MELRTLRFPGLGIAKPKAVRLPWHAAAEPEIARFSQVVESAVRVLTAQSTAWKCFAARSAASRTCSGPS